MLRRRGLTGIRALNFIFSPCLDQLIGLVFGEAMVRLKIIKYKHIVDVTTSYKQLTIGLNVGRLDGAVGMTVLRSRRPLCLIAGVETVLLEN